MAKPPMSFQEKVQHMMQRSGRTYHECLRALTSAGGKATARNKRQRRARIEARQIIEAAKKID